MFMLASLSEVHAGISMWPYNLRNKSKGKQNILLSIHYSVSTAKLQFKSVDALQRGTK